MWMASQKKKIARLFAWYKICKYNKAVFLNLENIDIRLT